MQTSKLTIVAVAPPEYDNDIESHYNDNSDPVDTPSSFDDTNSDRWDKEKVDHLQEYTAEKPESVW